MPSGRVVPAAGPPSEDADVTSGADYALTRELPIHVSATVVPVHEHRVMTTRGDGLGLDRPDLNNEPSGRTVGDHVADYSAAGITGISMASKLVFRDLDSLRSQDRFDRIDLPWSRGLRSRECCTGPDKRRKRQGHSYISRMHGGQSSARRAPRLPSPQSRKRCSCGRAPSVSPYRVR